VKRELGSVDGLTFLCVGDWRMRTMHSIGYAMSQFDSEIVYVCPDDMAPTDEFLAELASMNVRIRRVEHVAEAIAEADVIYMEPVVQADYTASREEATDRGLTPENYKVTRELMEGSAKSSSIILHSLPRMDELPPDVDITRHSRYWQEAFYGVVMRMTLLGLVLGAVE
jgi:aspartate carbamoyltransferase catalytic subunit